MPLWYNNTRQFDRKVQKTSWAWGGDPESFCSEWSRARKAKRWGQTFLKKSPLFSVNWSPTMNCWTLIEITSTELRKNIGKYLDIAMQKNEQVLVRYRNKGSFTITPAIEPGNVARGVKKNELEAYLEQPGIRESMKRSEEDFAAWRYREVTSIEELWQGIRWAYRTSNDRYR